MSKSKRIFTGFFVAVLLIAGCLIWRAFKMQHDALSVSGIVQASEVNFGPRQSGRIEQIFVREGQMLKKGQPILSMDAPELLEQLEAVKAKIDMQKDLLSELHSGNTTEQVRQAEAKMKEAEARYSLFSKGSRTEDIQAAKAEMDSLKAEMERAERFTQRQKALFSELIISKDQLDEAETTEKSLRERFEQAKSNYERAQSGFRKEEVAQSQYSLSASKAYYDEIKRGARSERISAEHNRLRQMQAEEKELLTRINELAVRSPCNCELSEFDLKPGNLVLANQVLGTLVDLEHLWIEAYLPEEYYGKVKLREEVQLTTISFPGKTFAGWISFIGLHSEFTPRNIQTIEARKQQVFKIKVSISDPETKRLFRPGMDVELKFN